MTQTLIPDTAPFSPEQRAWLNGFLAGWTGLDAVAGDGAALGQNGQAAMALAAPLNGTTNGAANGTTNGHAAEEEDLPWHDPNLPIDERLQLAEGKPLERRLMAAMAQLDCGACGYVCKTYSAAIAANEEKSLTLCAPGGKETAKTLKRLVKEAAAAGNGATNSLAASNGLASTNGHATTNGHTSSNGYAATNGQRYSRANPLLAKIKHCSNLNGPGSAKHTSHVVIDLADSGLDYRVGDALGVYPTNCPELVADILASLGAGGDEPVTCIDGRQTTLRHALAECCELGEASEELAELLIAATSDAPERARLLRLATDDALDELDVLDALKLVPSAQVDAARLVATLGTLAPRLYSIASSLRAHPAEVHLTVGRVTYERDGRMRKGVASTMFSDRLQPGDAVRVFPHASSDFTVPADPAAPMIMVGPGTGIAPFRAFLQERRAAVSTGQNWLFFGDQHFDSDFLYREELDVLCESGVLTRLSTAFSRDQDQKVYVQDRLREEGDELFRWLEQGAYFFVCGDARRMAVDVDRALHDIVAAEGRMSVDDTARYVAEMKRTHRYVRDVY
jgi:sulfite reductase (NADPH) flavoprotein alpha-component